jgi:hypothetical protein
MVVNESSMASGLKLYAVSLYALLPDPNYAVKIEGGKVKLDVPKRAPLEDVISFYERLDFHLNYRHIATMVVAGSDDEAKEEAMKAAHDFFPESEGFVCHAASVYLIPRDILIDVVNQMPEDQPIEESEDLDGVM